MIKILPVPVYHKVSAHGFRQLQEHQCCRLVFSNGKQLLDILVLFQHQLPDAITVPIHISSVEDLLFIVLVQWYQRLGFFLCLQHLSLFLPSSSLCLSCCAFFFVIHLSLDLHRFSREFLAWCQHLPLLIYRDDIRDYLNEYKLRIGKLIYASFAALVDSVAAWNNEEKREEVFTYIFTHLSRFDDFKRVQNNIQMLALVMSISIRYHCSFLRRSPDI